MRNSRFKKIEEKILSLEKGSVFAVADFVNIAQPKTVSKTLERLSKSGSIEKVVRSIFWLPDGINPNPDPRMVADALARENNWKLTPSGDTAIHVMGLSILKPSKWTYLTDGTYRKYSFGDIVISLQHISAPYYEKISAKTSMLIQVIKAYGRKKLDSSVVNKIRSKYNESEMKKAADSLDFEYAAMLRDKIFKYKASLDK